MTQLSTLVELVGKLPDEQRQAIAGLIDLKTEGDMQKVLDRLDVMEQKFEAKFEAMDQKFDALNHKINTTQWFIGGLIALAAIASRIL